MCVWLASGLLFTTVRKSGEVLVLVGVWNDGAFGGGGDVICDEKGRRWARPCAVLSGGD